MGAAFDRLRPDHCQFITAQPLFFVATAPSGDGGHVNVSPKGYDTFRVLDEVIPLGDPRFDDLAASLPQVAGARSIIRVELDRVQTSCGYAVPHMQFVANRPKLEEWADHRGPDGLEQYWADRNRESIDGIPALDSVRAAGE